MKYIYQIFVLLICNTIFAQDPQLPGATWYLQNLIINGENYPPPYNDEIQNVEALFYAISNGDSVNGFSTFVCNNLSGLVEYDSNNQSFSFPVPLEATLIVCNLQVNEDFEGLYFNFYDSTSGNQFNYTITTDSNDNKSLRIISNTGDQAIYSDHVLSSEDFYSPGFAIYPNPAKKELFMSSKSATGNLKVKILNIEGKLLSTQTITLENQTAINVSQLTSGMYFLNIEDQKGNTTIKKFIKQ
jgi:hypothetical protein